MRRFVQLVLEIQFLTNCSDVRLHLTAKGSKKADRRLYPSFWPYQSKRNSTPKPPLLEPLRQAVYDALQRETGELPNEWWCELHNYWEADDGIIMDSIRLGDDSVVWSEDKDMRLARGPYFELKTGQTDFIDNRFGWINEDFTEGGKLKVKGHGTAFFWAQMLMGDSADRVRGLERYDGKLIAERGALEIIQNCASEVEAAEKVLWAYARHGQNPLAEAEMMWLRRSATDSAHRYITDLDIDPRLIKWMNELNAYHREVIAARRTALIMEERETQTATY
ncbi:putative DNA exonuclease [Pseudomonas phage MR7]|nr:putative DNA exonuclease [Pseudomonas phage MR7]